MKKDPKVMIMGLNAATRTLIRPWMAEGGRPNLARLMHAGGSGRRESIPPPISRHIGDAPPKRSQADEESAKLEERLQAHATSNSPSQWS